jgi:hypothetical protein
MRDTSSHLGLLHLGSVTMPILEPSKNPKGGQVLALRLSLLSTPYHLQIRLDLTI